MKTERITIRISKRERGLLEKEAKNKGISISKLIRLYLTVLNF